MKSVHINLSLPESWSELSDKQLRYVFQLLSAEFSSDEIKTLCLLRWSDTKVIGRQQTGSYLLRHRREIFEVKPVDLAELLPALEWLGSIPRFPVRLSVIRRQKALPADFSEVAFETFIICDNLYQGYLATQDDELLDQLGSTLYNKDMRFKPYERTNIFYWFASLKEWLSRKYCDFFQPMDSATEGNLLGNPADSVETAVNAQIRALTKGDVTKEDLVLSLDTHRALTELNAQAREYKEINIKANVK